uniref:neurofilament medium polypeptide-like n=1 Tax=Bombus vancouverensis nearcticus TaxID=2705178 RepID=UPI00143ACC50|nr:neurofilament medium polypeptide-like [Bombus vancouverensis nearcticus]
MAVKVKKPVRSTVARKGQITKETKETTRSGSPRAAAGRLRKVDKSRLKGKKIKRKLRLKGWLATPADWARFNAWAKFNAIPKKLPQPEPIVRPSKPLSQLKKRIKMLSKPKERIDESIHCKLDLAISKAALKAIPSKRTILLSLPNIKLVDFGRVYYKVSPAALNYQPSQRIIELSLPRVILPEECKPSRLMSHEKRKLDEDRLRKLALAKKLLDCPEQLTKEEIEELFTPYGIKRTALSYRITPWLDFLAVPSYKTIKDKKDKQSKAFKKMIIEEGEERGRIAFAEYREKEEGERRGKKRKPDDTRTEKSKSRENGKVTEADEGEEEVYKSEEEERKAKRRKLEKHAWRFAPHPCIDDPTRITKAALNAKASARMEELAKPNIHKSKTIRTDAFTVKRSALAATASGRVESLAKPPRPRSPVEKRPPREKDKYGRPIFEMPVYGKVLPKTKPYKMGECPEPKKKRVVKKRPIDPIIYEATYDPCIYPDLAKKQRMERKRAEKLLGKKHRRRTKRRKKLERPEEEREEDVTKYIR